MAATITSLTAEKHLLKQMALRFLVDKSMSVADVARNLETTKPMIRSFFEDEDFLKDLDERVERIHGIDSDYRAEQAQISLSVLYEELRRREAKGELEDIPMRDLHRIIVDTQKELRLDTPGDFTSKVGVADLVSLQDRYQRSLSGRMHKRSANEAGLKRVNPIKRLGVGEANSNDKGSNRRISQGS